MQNLGKYAKYCLNLHGLLIDIFSATAISRKLNKGKAVYRVQIRSSVETPCYNSFRLESAGSSYAGVVLMG